MGVMIITNPLPLRTCSRCLNWFRANASPDDTGKQKAHCLARNERMYGSDSCTKWEKRE